MRTMMFEPGVYLKRKGGLSFGRTPLTQGLVRLPDYAWLRGTAREVRRISRQNGHKLTRATIEAAFERSIDELNPKDD